MAGTLLAFFDRIQYSRLRGRHEDDIGATKGDIRATWGDIFQTQHVRERLLDIYQVGCQAKQRKRFCRKMLSFMDPSGEHTTKRRTETFWSPLPAAFVMRRLTLLLTRSGHADRQPPRPSTCAEPGVLSRTESFQSPGMSLPQRSVQSEFR